MEKMHPVRLLLESMRSKSHKSRSETMQSTKAIRITKGKWIDNKPSWPSWP